MDDDVLRRTPLFAALDDAAAAALRATMSQETVARGDVVFSEGEPGDRLFIIVDGKVKLGQTSSDGREQVMAVLGPGAMFGELSLFDPGDRTSTASAVTDSVLLSLSQRDLRPWLTGRPEVAEALLQALAQRLRRANEAMADLVFSDVPGRVAKALLDLAEKFGQPQPDGSTLVAHDLTQEELAQLVGASRETVNKSLADFVAWCKANPTKAAYATTSAGATPHFVGMMLANAARIPMTAVHYRGGAPALQDLLGGHVPASVNPISETLPFVRAGTALQW